MRRETLQNISGILAVVAVAAVVVAAVVVVVAVVVVAAVVVVVAVVVVAVVVAVVFDIEEPKTSIMASCCLIGICAASLFFTLPVALHPPQTIQVVCQTFQTQTQIYIHDSTTQTITQVHTSNETLIQIVNQVHCP